MFHCDICFDLVEDDEMCSCVMNPPQSEWLTKKPTKTVAIKKRTKGLALSQHEEIAKALLGMKGHLDKYSRLVTLIYPRSKQAQRFRALAEALSATHREMDRVVCSEHRTGMEIPRIYYPKAILNRF